MVRCPSGLASRPDGGAVVLAQQFVKLAACRNQKKCAIFVKLSKVCKIIFEDVAVSRKYLSVCFVSVLKSDRLLGADVARTSSACRTVGTMPSAARRKFQPLS